VLKAVDTDLDDLATQLHPPLDPVDEECSRCYLKSVIKIHLYYQ
jgi:hypothetical protein